MNRKLDRAAAKERCEKATRPPLWDSFHWLTSSNENFIFHARTDLPLALAELDAQDTIIALQRAEITTLRNALDAAPCSWACASRGCGGLYPLKPCNCWKSATHSTTSSTPISRTPTQSVVPATGRVV